MSYQLSLVGKTALVTATGQRVGRASAKAFARTRARVFATGQTHTIDGGWTA